MTRETLLCALTALALCACGGRRGTTISDGGSDAFVPPGTPVVRVRSASWVLGLGSSDGLLLEVEVTNPAGEAPTPLAPSSFSVETASGAVVTGASAPAMSCRADTSVAGGATLACSVVFGINRTSSPTTLDYDPPGHHASAAIAACSAAAPSGLCAAGQFCDAGACGGACSPDNTAGRCTDPTQVCVDGACEDGCSPSNPTGPCTMGACNGGVCDPSCHALTFTGDCEPCLAGAFGSGGACAAEAADCTPCSCALSENSCTCGADPSCSGCDLAAFYACEAAACPGCVS